MTATWYFVASIVITITSTFALPNSTGFSPEVSVVHRVYDDCKDTNDFLGCLKEKAITAISKAIDQDSIKIVDGLTMERENNSNDNESSNSSILGLTDARTLDDLSLLDRQLLEKVDKFLQSHVIKFDMADEKVTGRRRGGLKKHHGIKYVVAALLTAMGIAGPLGLKALAAIAGKALVISKVALTIAGIIALKKLFSHDHNEETSFQVHAGDHNRRNSFLVRPVKPSPSATLDPYRYYYEYPQQ